MKWTIFLDYRDDNKQRGQNKTGHLTIGTPVQETKEVNVRSYRSNLCPWNTMSSYKRYDLRLIQESIRSDSLIV